MALIFEIGDDNIMKQERIIEELQNNSSYNTFFQTCMKNNTPCIIKDIGLNWAATKQWVDNDKINFDFLIKKYGKCEVTIYDCNEKYYNSQKTNSSLLEDYIAEWENAKEKLYYIKDWHLQNEFPEDFFYRVPIFFASDWLNEYLCENAEDDYRFVYMGPTGTWTPFHADVFSSYSWSINICGQKKWLLFPPGEENKLRDSLGNLPYDVTSLSLEKCKYFEVIQNVNEAIFIPSCWHHQVWNTKDTISINHNWINGCNINFIWESLEKNLIAVENEIDDCRVMDNFEEHCQLMLKVSYGLDFAKFYHFLNYIAVKRLHYLENNVKIISFGQHELGTKHALFDLERIKHVLELFMNNPAGRKLNLLDDSINAEDLLDKINSSIAKRKV